VVADFLLVDATKRREIYWKVRAIPRIFPLNEEEIPVFGQISVKFLEN
jgi:hypothetical protein